MEESEFVGGCKEPMEEDSKGKGLALSSKTQTIDGKDAKTAEVLVDSGVCVVSVTDKNPIGGGSTTEYRYADSSASGEILKKFDAGSVEKTVSSDYVEVKPVDEIESSEICDDVQRVGETVSLVEVEMNDEATKHSESAPVPEESSQLSKGDGKEGNSGTGLEVSSAGGICSEEELTNVNQEEAMEIDYAAEEHVEKAGNELQNSMKRGTNMQPIPTDLIIEIFSRLPAKSVGRFRSLSKVWCSMLSRPDFIELFLSRSCARPRLLFSVERKGVWSFFSSPQPSSSSLVVTADFHSRFSEDISRFTCSYASGLFYFRDLWNPRVGQLYVVCNPVTGQYVTLPNVDMYRKSRGFLGFDPVEKKFKVLAEGHPFCSQRDHHEILTLGTGEISWRKKKFDCPQYDSSLCEGICIHGVLYYVVDNFSDIPGNIVRFDLRTEEFRFVVTECFADLKTTKLINYKGKLGGINCSYGEAGGKYTLELRLCVLEDFERHEWSTYVYTLPENKRIDDPSNVSVIGATPTGEIVLAMDYTCKPYYVFYFNPEKNTLKSVEIQGFGAELEAVKYRGRVHVFVDHVEHLDVEDFKHCGAKHTCTSCKGCVQDLNIVDSKQLGSSIFGNQVKRCCSSCEEQEKKERQ